MNIKALIMKYFEDHAGQRVYVESITGDLDMSKSQIQAAVYQIARTNQLPGLEVISQGNVWLFQPTGTADPSAPQAETLTVVRTLKSGAKLAEDSDGNVYKAVLIED